MWVAPFGNLRITGYLLLPEAYRSLSRPSSAPDAKAFPLRSFQLDLSSLPRPVREIGSLKNYAGFTKIEIVIVTLHPFGCCSTIKICLPRFLTQQPLCCLTFIHVTLFSFQGAAFQPLLKSDRNTRSLECFDLISNWWR